MSDIKPEDLKRLAIYMGYEATIGAITEKEVVFIWQNGDESLYAPHLTNAEQCLEIEVKFKMDTTYLGAITNGWLCRIYDKSGMGFPIAEATGKTPSEARVNAAIAAITGE
jgi:hypothetical protein